MSILAQQKQVDKIDTNLLKQQIAQNVKDVNRGQGLIRKQTEVVTRFKSVVGFYDQGGDRSPGIIEISIKVKMLAPHFNEEEYLDALEEMDEHDYERS